MVFIGMQVKPVTVVVIMPNCMLRMTIIETLKQIKTPWIPEIRVVLKRPNLGAEDVAPEIGKIGVSIVAINQRLVVNQVLREIEEVPLVNMKIGGKKS